jgi:Mg-chelatase subunit ChlI
MENIFDTSVLVQVVPNLKTSQNWLLDRFFPNVVTYETEEVAIDVDVGLRRMAPFVSPHWWRASWSNPVNTRPIPSNRLTSKTSARRPA